MLRLVKYFGLPLVFGLLVACTGSGYKSYSANNVAIDSAYNSSELDGIISPYREGLESKMNEVIGTCDSSLVKYTPESPLSNFAADVVFETGIDLNPAGFESATRENTISLLNFGGLRAPINEGDITVGNVFELMPFDNTIVMVKLKPAAIAVMLEYLLNEGGQPVGNSKFKLSKSEKEFTVNNKLFDAKNDLYVITSNYLASGGDNMTFLRDSDLKWDSGLLIRDVFIQHIRTTKRIQRPAISGRMILNK